MQTTETRQEQLTHPAWCAQRDTETPAEHEQHRSPRRTLDLLDYSDTVVEATVVKDGGSTMVIELSLWDHGTLDRFDTAMTMADLDRLALFVARAKADLDLATFAEATDRACP